jgi:TonB family protein
VPALPVAPVAPTPATPTAPSSPVPPPPRDTAAQQDQALKQAKLDRGKQDAQRKAEQLEAERQEMARAEAARVESERREAARLEAARQDAARAEAARLEAQRQEAMRIAAKREESIRQETARAEAARVEAARQEAADRQEAARQDTARVEAARLAALQAEATKREEKLRAIGRQLNEEADRREAAAAIARLSPAWSGGRRARLFGHTDTNAELILYAEAWSRKIHLNMTFDMVREAAKQRHADPLVTVAIRSDGSVESITFVRSSGVPALDEAIRRVVNSQANYQAFPPALASEYDVVEIRRTWRFDMAIRLQ